MAKRVGHETGGNKSPINGDISVNEVNQQIGTLTQQINTLESTLSQKIADIETKINNKADINNLDGRLKIIEDSWKKQCKIPAWGWILLASIGGAVVFMLAMILFQKWLGFEVSYENGATTIVLGFVGIAATFVIVSNYAQVKEIEGRFESQIKESKRELTSTFDKKIKDNKFISEASALRIEGNRYMHSNEYLNALRCYMRALNFTNNLFEKIEVDGIIVELEWLQIHISEIKITMNERDVFVQVLEKSKHRSSESLIENFIKRIDLSDNQPVIESINQN
jgi:uncharacterized small protein (DUF1192 family)